MRQPRINFRRLHSLEAAAVAAAGSNQRQKNAVRRGAQLLRDGRVERDGENSIRVHSPSGKTYITSFEDCREEEGGPRCVAHEQGQPCKHRQALNLLDKLGRGMTVQELISKAAEGWPELAGYFDAESGKAVEGDGDGLALFVVRELVQTFDAEADYDAQMEEAERVIERAADDLNNVLAAFQKAAAGALAA